MLTCCKVNTSIPHRPSEDRSCSEMHLPGTTPWRSLVQDNTLPTRSCPQILDQPRLWLKTVPFCPKYLIWGLPETLCWCRKVCGGGGRQRQHLNLSWLHEISTELWSLRKETAKWEGSKEDCRRRILVAYPTSLDYNPIQHPVLISSHQEIGDLLVFLVVFTGGSCP